MVYDYKNTTTKRFQYKIKTYIANFNITSSIRTIVNIIYSKNIIEYYFLIVCIICENIKLQQNEHSVLHIKRKHYKILAKIPE